MTIREIILERWILTPGRYINLLFLAATFAIGCEVCERGGRVSAEQIEGRGASGDGFCPSPDEGELRDRLREVRAHAEGDPGEGLPLVASLCHELAWDLLEEGLLSDAETLVREELAAVRFLAANDPETFLPRVADACENLAGILWEGGDPAEAEPLYREALSLRRSLVGREPAGDLLSEAAHTCIGLARLLEEREPGEAEELYREALSLRRSLAGQDPAEGPLSEVASSCVDLALFLEDLGRLEEAEPLLREALGTYRSLRGGHALSWAAMVARTGFVLARVLDCAGRPEEVEPLLREALGCYRSLAAADPGEDGLPALIPEAGSPMGALATILAEGGRVGEAEELFRGGLSMYAILSEAHPEREDFRLGEEAFRDGLAQLSDTTITHAS